MVVAGCGVGLVLAVAAVYGQTVRFGFVNYDDPSYVTENSRVLRGLSADGVAWAATTDHGLVWVPLTWLSLMLDAQCYGAHAGGYHLTNVLMHAASSVLLLRVLWRATGRPWPAAIAAAIFALHPLRVEAVAWVTARKDVLSGLLFMLTAAAYGSYARHRFSTARYALVAFLFALGLMAKSMVVTTPLLLLVADYWPLGRMHGRRDLPKLVLEKLPLLALSAAAAAITLAVQGDALVSTHRLSPAWRLGQATLAYADYLAMLVWPVNLAAAYPRAEATLSPVALIRASALMLLITAVAWRERRRHPYLLAGWLWYLVAFVPVIGLVQVGAMSMADRFTYIPLIGPVVALVWLATDFVAPEGGRTDFADSLIVPGLRAPRWSPAAVAAAGGAACVLIASLAVASWVQTTSWRTSEALWRLSLDRTERNWFAHVSLADCLLKQERYAEAETEARAALAIDPNDTVAAGYLGFIAAAAGRRDEAMAMCRSVIARDRRHPRVHTLLGCLLAEEGRYREALDEYRIALDTCPDLREALVNMGEAMLRCDMPRQAMETLLQARRMWPADPLVARQLGRVFVATGRGPEGLECLRESVTGRPDDADAWSAFGAALGQAGRFDEAIEALRRAVSLRPGEAEMHRNLGFALQESGRFTEASASYREAIARRSEDVASTNDLAWLLATCPDASIRDGVEAVALATEANRRTAGSAPVVLDTLAASYAEAGRFSDAVETARRALLLAEERGESDLAAGVRDHLASFERGKPVRQPAEMVR